jgi:potassium-transporting ATPase ATP-binding subunit
LAALASAADETPEGKSIVTAALAIGVGSKELNAPAEVRFIPFSAQTRMSGVDFPDGRTIRKGAPDAVIAFVQQRDGAIPAGLQQSVDAIASKGATPLVVAENTKIAGVVALEDILKPGMLERFERLRRMGLRTVMITGDNPLTAAAIAAEAGVDDFLAQATPENKLDLIRQEQAGGKLVAMTGDGTNDAPALAQADVGVAMNSGTQAAKEAGNLVDLDSDPTKLIEIVETGKQMLITRGALTTFSIANDVAKYFAIIPAMFTAYAALKPLSVLNVMGLHSAHSAILSAVIFNALIIIALVPLALRGVRFRAVGAAALLRRNLLIYGLGGIIAPFIGIKIIDVIITAIHLV